MEEVPQKIQEPNEEEMKEIPYRQAIGKLMYAMIGTRPDIAYAVSKLSQYMKNYGKQHWTAVKRIFRYLNGTKEYYLKLYGSGKRYTGNILDVQSTSSNR